MDISTLAGGGVEVKESRRSFQIPSPLGAHSSRFARLESRCFYKESAHKAKTWVQSLDREDTPEEKMETHSSILAWRIPWAEEPGGLQSMGPQRVRHD